VAIAWTTLGTERGRLLQERVGLRERGLDEGYSEPGKPADDGEDCGNPAAERDCDALVVFGSMTMRTIGAVLSRERRGPQHHTQSTVLVSPGSGSIVLPNTECVSEPPKGGGSVDSQSRRPREGVQVTPPCQVDPFELECHLIVKGFGPDPPPLLGTPVVR
jgi:hypothetical protein